MHYYVSNSVTELLCVQKEFFKFAVELKQAEDDTHAEAVYFPQLSTHTHTHTHHTPHWNQRGTQMKDNTA